MILVSSDIKKRFPEAFRLARKDKMRVVWVENDLAYVARRDPGHDKYLVRFDVLRTGQVSVSCKSISGRACNGSYFKGLCAHAAKAILRGQYKADKKKREAA